GVALSPGEQSSVRYSPAFTSAVHVRTWVSVPMPVDVPGTQAETTNSPGVGSRQEATCVSASGVQAAVTYSPFPGSEQAPHSVSDVFVQAADANRPASQTEHGLHEPS